MPQFEPRSLWSPVPESKVTFRVRGEGARSAPPGLILREPPGQTVGTDREHRRIDERCVCHVERPDSSPLPWSLDASEPGSARAQADGRAILLAHYRRSRPRPMFGSSDGTFASKYSLSAGSRSLCRTSPELFPKDPFPRATTGRMVQSGRWREGGARWSD